ncbi:MAG: TonB-dependent receptor, partial [Wenzhouxiangellaceae bacterium]
QDNYAWRFVFGADGQFGPWFWDAAVSHGRNETDQRKTGDLLDDRLRLALGPSFRDASGRAVCGTPLSPIAGCVPLNLFGGPGSITPEMLGFVGTRLDDTGFNEQTVFDLNFTGDLLTAPAGPIAAAAGFEWRQERGVDRPDSQTQAGNTTGNARALTRGEFDSREIYLEFGVPLLAGARLARSMDLDLGARLVDFSNFGTESIFEVGLGWQPLDALSFRGAWSESFRAPNVGELFGAQSQSNPIVNDPCSDFAVLTTTEIQRCVDQGVPADGSFSQSGEETPQLSGGNPDLAPESADIVTVGLSWQPPAMEGLRLALDYHDIEISDGIGALGASTILEQCLATGAMQFCDAIEREPSGAIGAVQARLQNIADETARGVDLELEWLADGQKGSFHHRLMLSHVIERELVAFAGAAPLFGAGGFDQDNFGAIPEWRGQYRVDWHRADWKLGYRAHWIGEIRERGDEVFPGTVNRAGAVLYHDVDVEWTPGPGWRLSAGIQNLTDIEPPFLANADAATTDVGTDRALGT